MTDTAAIDSKTIEHDPNELQRPAEPEQQPDPKPTAPAEPMPEVGSPLRQRAELVPISTTGAAPANLGQQIDFAQYMARASFAVPMHLRDNPGACLAVLDIATRAGLSPFMVANKTYVQSDRLAFESQLFHALLVQSGLLIGDLLTEWEGEGDARKCTVIGTLKSDGIARSHTSQTLAEARPASNDRGQIKGSPLWKDKPDVQLFYDTSRDWTRMYAPTATLGIYTPEEMIEHPILGDPSRTDGAIDGGRPDPSLHKRLKGVNREEGHQPGHAESELASVAAGGTTKIKPAAAAKTEKAQPKETLPTRTPRAERRKKRQSASAPKPDQNKQKSAEVPAAEEQAGGAEKSPIQTRAEREQANAPNGKPKTNAEYWPYAIKWIDDPVPDGVDPAEHATHLEERWETETHMRDDIAVPIARRKEIEKHLIARCKELRGQE